MSVKEIDRYKIEVRENGSTIVVYLFNGAGLRASASVSRNSQKVTFVDAQGQTPSAASALDSGTVDFSKYCSRALLAGQQAEMIILDAAYQFVLTNDAINYDTPSLETEDYDLILSARSDTPTSFDPAPASGKGGGSPRPKPRRKKFQTAIWI